MKFKRSMIPGKNLVEIRLEGSITVKEILEDMADFLTEYPDDGRLNFLIDSTGGNYDMRFEDIQDFFQRAEPLLSRFGPVKWAIVAPGDANFGILRMVMAVSEGSGVEFQAFRDRESAMAWIAE